MNERKSRIIKSVVLCGLMGTGLLLFRPSTQNDRSSEIKPTPTTETKPSPTIPSPLNTPEIYNPQTLKRTRF